MPKSTTKKIVIFEPDQAQLKRALEDRELSPGLIKFLENLLKTRRWTRRINIPSGHQDLAAVLVFTTALKEGGLEIYSELHVFLAGEVMVEKWQVVGEDEQISSLPKEAFAAIDVEKVRAQGSKVTVEFSAPVVGGRSSLTKVFDFAVDGPSVRFVAHPLLGSHSSVPTLTR